MAGSIGGISCDILRGNPALLSERTEVWHRPGTDGLGVQTMGLGLSQGEFIAVKYGTESAIETWIRDVEALTGTIVSITNDWSRTYANMLVLGVRASAKQPGIVGDGPRAELRISTRQVSP